MIGQYEACFDRRSLFIYKTHTECTGFSIRKKNLHALKLDHPVLYRHIKRKALFHYIQRIRRPLLEQKQLDIEHYQTRADYKQVLYLRNTDDQEIQKIVDNELAKSIYEKESAEILIMKEMEKKVNSYERYLTKIIKNYDQAGEIYEVVSQEHDQLLIQNQELRQMAAE